MDRLSDTQIRAGLRNIMSFHRIDLTQTSFICASGVVRMTGELKRQAAYQTLPISEMDVGALEQDINRVKGVVRVHFDFKGWRREGSGEWKYKEPVTRPRATDEPEDDDDGPITLGELPPIPWTTM